MDRLQCIIMHHLGIGIHTNIHTTHTLYTHTHTLSSVSYWIVHLSGCWYQIENQLFFKLQKLFLQQSMLIHAYSVELGPGFSWLLPTLPMGCHSRMVMLWLSLVSHLGLQPLVCTTESFSCGHTLPLVSSLFLVTVLHSLRVSQTLDLFNPHLSYHCQICLCPLYFLFSFLGNFYKIISQSYYWDLVHQILICKGSFWLFESLSFSYKLPFLF